MNLYLQLGSNNFHEIRYNDRLNSSPIIGPSSDYEGYEQDVIDVKTAISTVPFVHNLAFAIPVAGTPVPYNVRRKAGSYLLGHRRATCPVKCMYICCARREKTHKFYTIKVLSLQDEGIDTITQDDIQGMFLMHNEYILLNRLAETSGVYNVHAYFRDLYAEEEMNENSILVYTGRVKVRLCLVLDFVAPNDTYPICELENLQQYVVEKKVLTEREAITIFREILLIVKILHDKNIVHRDIKLGNMMLHRKTLKVTLINFGLGRSLSKENVLLSDQRGSPAYISPDVLSGTPYAPKPSDMWSLGVSLYIMLMGCFPFYDVNVNQLFNKVIRGSYIIPL